MISITAILRVRPGHETTLRDALTEMLESVRREEPGTVGYFISQSIDQPQVFTTYERFVDVAAMERHNSSAAVAKVLRIAEPILADKVVLHSSNEVASKEAR
jgi:quinol monooxygenase YgiN